MFCLKVGVIFDCKSFSQATKFWLKAHFPLGGQLSTLNDIVIRLFIYLFAFFLPTLLIITSWFCFQFSYFVFDFFFLFHLHKDLPLIKKGVCRCPNCSKTTPTPSGTLKVIISEAWVESNNWGWPWQIWSQIPSNSINRRRSKNKEYWLKILRQ